MNWLDFYKGKKILVTGHTGFKGSWMSQMLLLAGAEVSGYALSAPTSPSLFELCGLADEMNSVEGDIRDLEKMKKCSKEEKEELLRYIESLLEVRRNFNKK